MKVYVLCGCYDYEGFNILGIYQNYADAAKRKNEFKEIAKETRICSYTKYENSKGDSYDSLEILEEELIK